MDHIIEHEYKENCFILTSFSVRNGNWEELEVNPTVSFLYRGENVAAEWEVKYGPIQIWEKANEGDKESQEHYAYPFIKETCGAWSQLAVEKENLKPALQCNDFDYIFSVLQKWAERDAD